MRSRCGVAEFGGGRRSKKTMRAAGLLKAAVAILCVNTILGTTLFAQTQQRSLAELSPRKSAQNKTTPNTPIPNTSKPARPTGPDMAWLQEAMKDPELMAEVGRLTEKLQKGIPYPAARSQSQILPRLSDSTIFYLAIPNYGDTVHKALQIFQQGLNESPHLRAFLQKNNFDAVWPSIESAGRGFYEVSQYLGDEVVIAAKLDGKEPSGVLIAEVKKPGLRDVLDKINNEVFTGKVDRMRVIGPQQLTAGGESDTHGATVLVRDDFMIFGLSAASLRDYNSQLDERGTRFNSQALGRRLDKAYEGGTNTVIGLDLHQLISLMPVTSAQSRDFLEKSGLGDLRWMVSESTFSANASRSQGELVFNGPRHGFASWLASPTQLNGLDFVPSSAATAFDMMLKSPAQILDDVRDMMGEKALPQLEAQLKINLKRDLLSKLTGEIGYESPTGYMFPPTGMAPKTTLAPAGSPQMPPFAVILGTSDAKGLQDTFLQLLAASPFQPAARDEGGVTFYTITMPGAAGTPTEINYFFLDGYMVIASDRAVAEESLRAHRKGTSVLASGKLREALGRGQSTTASMLGYQNGNTMISQIMAQLPAEMRQSLPAVMPSVSPNVFAGYADESSIRGYTNNSVSTEMALGLIAGAVLIPNLARGSRTAVANDSEATTWIRVVNSAQSAYSTKYPDRGYAPALAILGPPANGPCVAKSGTADHACLLDSMIANASCTTGSWCEKNGYKFGMRGICLSGRCMSYAVSATPASGGGTNFCSTDNGVVRSHSGPPLATPVTTAECKTWMPVR